MPINISFQANAVIILNSIPSFLLYRSTLPQRPLIWVYSGLAFHGFTLHSLKCSPLKVSVFSASLDKLCGIIRSRERINSFHQDEERTASIMGQWEDRRRDSGAAQRGSDAPHCSALQSLWRFSNTKAWVYRWQKRTRWPWQQVTPNLHIYINSIL